MSTLPIPPWQTTPSQPPLSPQQPPLRHPFYLAPSLLSPTAFATPSDRAVNSGSGSGDLGSGVGDNNAAGGEGVFGGPLRYLFESKKRIAELRGFSTQCVAVDWAEAVVGKLKEIESRSYLDLVLWADYDLDSASSIINTEEVSVLVHQIIGAETVEAAKVSTQLLVNLYLQTIVQSDSTGYLRPLFASLLSDLYYECRQYYNTIYYSHVLQPILSFALHFVRAIISYMSDNAMLEKTGELGEVMLGILEEVFLHVHQWALEVVLEEGIHSPLLSSVVHPLFSLFLLHPIIARRTLLHPTRSALRKAPGSCCNNSESENTANGECCNNYKSVDGAIIPDPRLLLALSDCTAACNGYPLELLLRCFYSPVTADQPGNNFSPHPTAMTMTPEAANLLLQLVHGEGLEPETPSTRAIISCWRATPTLSRLWGELFLDGVQRFGGSLRRAINYTWMNVTGAVFLQQAGSSGGEREREREREVVQRLVRYFVDESDVAEVVGDLTAVHYVPAKVVEVLIHSALLRRTGPLRTEERHACVRFLSTFTRTTQKLFHALPVEISSRLEALLSGTATGNNSGIVSPAYTSAQVLSGAVTGNAAESWGGSGGRITPGSGRFEGPMVYQQSGSVRSLSHLDTFRVLSQSETDMGRRILSRLLQAEVQGDLTHLTHRRYTAEILHALIDPNNLADSMTLPCVEARVIIAATKRDFADITVLQQFTETHLNDPLLALVDVASSSQACNNSLPVDVALHLCDVLMRWMSVSKAAITSCNNSGRSVPVGEKKAGVQGIEIIARKEWEWMKGEAWWSIFPGKWNMSMYEEFLTGLRLVPEYMLATVNVRLLHFAFTYLTDLFHGRTLKCARGTTPGNKYTPGNNFGEFEEREVDVYEVGEAEKVYLSHVRVTLYMLLLHLCKVQEGLEQGATDAQYTLQGRKLLHAFIQPVSLRRLLRDNDPRISYFAAGFLLQNLTENDPDRYDELMDELADRDDYESLLSNRYRLMNALMSLMEEKRL